MNIVIVIFGGCIVERSEKVSSSLANYFIEKNVLLNMSLEYNKFLNYRTQI